MKKYYVIILLCTIFSIGVVASSFAQPGMMWKGSEGWGPGSKYGRMYDVKTVGTISGEVVSIEKIRPMSGMSYGVHLKVKTAQETVTVHLGPSWYMEKQDVKIEAKDRIEVTGSRITFNGEPAIIAAKIVKGNDVLILRDEAGIPFWSGWRRR